MIEYFTTAHYRRHNQSRLEHLASLGLPLSGRTVLELGAGIGDHTSFYLDQGCTVTSVEPRKELAEHLQSRFPQVRVIGWDVDTEVPHDLGTFEVCHCYGILYHTQNPSFVLSTASQRCSELIVIETCVSFGDLDELVMVNEDRKDPTQALRGRGCRPTRRWVFDRLQALWPYCYIPLTQPNHDEFPLDWTITSNPNASLARAVFIGSARALDSRILSNHLVSHQSR